MNEPTIRDGIEALGIFERDADAWAHSYDIAKMFGKRHADVIRAIEKATKEVSDEFNQRNFASVRRKDQKGEDRKAYRLNRKAFAYVVMGFTGAKAAQFKEAYIEGFEKMADLIFARRVTACGYREMSAAVHEKLGGGYHEEADMVNLAVLGMSSREYRYVFEIKPGQNPRDAVPQSILEKLDKAQRLNAQLILAGLSRQDRRKIIETNFRTATAA